MAATGTPFSRRFKSAVSPGFDPDRDLRRVGLANQTTMLMSESLRIADMFKAAMTDRYGASALDEHYQAFDTICSATQDRQDAVIALLRERPLDLMVVHRRLQQQQHLQSGSHLRRTTARPSISPIRTAWSRRRRSVIGRSGPRRRSSARAGCRLEGAVSVGLTSGASTPDNLVGAAVAILATYCAGRARTCNQLTARQLTTQARAPAPASRWQDMPADRKSERLPKRNGATHRIP